MKIFFNLLFNKFSIEFTKKKILKFAVKEVENKNTTLKQFDADRVKNLKIWSLMLSVNSKMITKLLNLTV